MYPDLPRDLIRTFFADYLHLVEPDAARKMRLDRITFPQKGYASGVIAEIPPVKGEMVTVMVRIEPERETPRSLAEDLRRLDLRYGQPVLLSVLRLTGGRPGAHLEFTTISEAFGIELARIYYTVFGLDGARAEYYLERPEPLAWALSAWMRPVRRSPEEHRRACLERIEASALPEMQRELLRRAFEEDRGQLPQESALVSWIGANGAFSRLS